MSKRTFIWFGILILVLAVVIPWLVFGSKGDGGAGEEAVASDLKSGQTLFEVNCGTCHALASAGADGNYGPDLDELLAPTGPLEEESTIESTESRVLNAVEQGIDTPTSPGRMPGGILNEEQSKEVAEFVARTAGQG
jgi:mono/diheme cytochrome c family protein